MCALRAHLLSASVVGPRPRMSVAAKSRLEQTTLRALAPLR
jgi:hypothetical protein